MDKTKRNNLITVSVILGVLTLISIFCLVCAVEMPSPDNRAPVFLLWISGIAMGLYLSALAMIVGTNE